MQNTIEIMTSYNFNNDYKQTDIHLRYANENAPNPISSQAMASIKESNKISFHIYNYISDSFSNLIEDILKNISDEANVRVTFHDISVKHNEIMGVTHTLANLLSINLFRFDKGALVVEFFERSIKPAHQKRRKLFLESLEDNLKSESQSKPVNEEVLMKELVNTKNDYDRLYNTYLKVHKRKQYAFRELDKFKKSAWKYKKLYLNHQYVINNLEFINTNKKKVNKRNLKKLIKLIIKKVRK
ncbi:hypothetical protein K0018_10080 [Staphylococcus massiliensis]|uniref:hypothetical protein n=1 Tax=Staphylococcus massiliensis TaxID=555791 RepID=UPI001EE0AFCD|nr:hypothetical protein [Staphylococcus massiliensis]MCG3413391.1 hypothetical protein [Staphylococcus massiliensis]